MGCLPEEGQEERGMIALIVSSVAALLHRHHF